MKNIKKSLLLVLLLLAVSCHEDELRPIVPVKQAKIDGVAVIDFPAGSIQADKVTIDKIDDPQVEYVFDETAEFFQVGNIVPYQIKLNIGQFPPESDRITATFTLPLDFLNSVPKNYGVELFALVYQDGGEEILDLFELLPSTRSSDGKSLTATLPIWLFTNKRNSSQTFEAVFMIASTPGDNSSGRISQPSDDEECQAGQISCPLGSVELCSQKKTSDFGQRTDPKTGKKNAVHWGLDFAAQAGTEIHAAADGVVERVRTQKDTKGTVIGYGLYVVIRHLNGSATLYAHLSRTTLTKGQKVTADQVIALSGNSGKSTGPHLHFE